MGADLRALRRRILTPNVSQVSLDERGFHKKDPAAQELLENIGRNFLAGYGHAAESRSLAELEHRLDMVPVRFRGFAHEGAAMGCTVVDALPGSRGRRLAGFLAGDGRHHVYMAYVGIGWAMARLPRFRWPGLSATSPLLRWLVLDGYGFHQAYFHTTKYVYGHHQDAPRRFPFEPASYVQRAMDQGIGRALWFIGGTDPQSVMNLIERFPTARHADLCAGVGLAATYAGGADEEELRLLLRLAGEHARQVGQGSAFAAEAREKAGLTGPETGLATRVLCGLEPAEAARLCRELQPGRPDDADGHAYEEWRQRIAEKISVRGEV
ncbi:DUF1702 family protein [Streptomyces clavuligerus]|nr:DUF1702 family protein [Streptomyces clavuligerus]EDY52384.1 UnbL [Streptomyces clavuligerus]MBY6306723.1 DUF1702 family protein [Streptomyces clavuligerus]QCS10669.1 DUF1702 domain-containing protein [Streptomyces clavuligerus]QPJ97294.1 DUF1702 family protein [Streptomyces clavuligerus]WDN57383.1 DUF1702 family protein [Streptomyces clavuligerus]